MKRLIIFCFAVLILFASCSEKKFTTKSKKYYLEHIQIAKIRSKDCKENGFTEDEKIDCRNAIVAYDEIKSKSNRPIFRDEKKVTDW